jgi:hypothetical protein
VNPFNSSASNSDFTLVQWCRVLLENLTVAQLLKKSPALYGDRKFMFMIMLETSPPAPI